MKQCALPLWRSRKAGSLGLAFCLMAFAVAATAAAPAIWLDVPFVKQPEEGCGAASLSMVMQYWLKQENRAPDSVVEVAKIQSALHSPEAHGIYASAMQAYLREHGFQAFAFSGQWSDLEHHLAKGRPLIAAIKPSVGSIGSNVPLHYLVIAGIDSQNGVVLVNDPAVRKLLKKDRSTFEKEWSATNNWLLLALPAKDGH